MSTETRRVAAELLDSWRARGRELEVFGQRVFVVDQPALDATDDGEDRAPLVVLHGYPTSSHDFHRVLPILARDRRVVLHDHLGFGFSDKPANYSYSLFEQAEVAAEVWRQLGLESAHLLAHDYGTSVATELLARRERGLLGIEVVSVTLSNGSVHRELAKLRLSQHIARSPLGPLFGRLVTRGYFKHVLRKLWGVHARADEADLDAMWDAIALHDGPRRTHAISSYLDERLRFRHRWIGALERLDLPAHILWGRRDPIAVPAIAEQMARETPGAQLTWLDTLGHYPMLEDPEAWGEAMVAFLEELAA